MIQSEEVIRAKLALLKKCRTLGSKSDTCLTMIDLLHWMLCEASAFEVLTKKLEDDITSYLNSHKNN